MPTRWQSLVDFVVLSVAFYFVLRWAKQARAVRIALLISGLYGASLLAREYDLVITSWVLSGAALLAITVLLVVFQPELRHAFMRVDAFLRAGPRVRSVLSPTYQAIGDAAFSLAQARLGALIVLVRRDAILELVQDGIPLDADVSRELLQSIFLKDSPLHDGAAIVNGNTIVRAKSVLPLTHRSYVPGAFGTRHRAAMGLAERSDAVTIAVSEERGTVTLMHGRELLHVESPEDLAQALESLHEGPKQRLFERMKRVATRNLRFKFAAIGLAAVVWALSISTSHSTVRTMSLQVEFSNVPRGMNIVSQSASSIDVQLRGNALVMASAPLSRMVANFSLEGAGPGPVTFTVGPGNLDLPPGVFVEKATPRTITVRLSKQQGTSGVH